MREPFVHGLRDNVARLHSGAGHHCAPGPGGGVSHDGALPLIQLFDVNFELWRDDETRQGFRWGCRAGLGSNAFWGRAGRVPGAVRGLGGRVGARAWDWEVGGRLISNDI